MSYLHLMVRTLSFRIIDIYTRWFKKLTLLSVGLGTRSLGTHYKFIASTRNTVTIFTMVSQDDKSTTTFDRILEMSMDSSYDKEEEDYNKVIPKSLQKKIDEWEAKENRGYLDEVEREEEGTDYEDFLTEEHEDISSFLKDQPSPVSKDEVIKPEDVDHGHPNDKVTAITLFDNEDAILHYGSYRRVFRPFDKKTEETKYKQKNIKDFFDSKNP